MQISFRLRGKTVKLSQLEDTVALKRQAGTTARKQIQSFKTARAGDDSRGGGFGEALPAANRKLFERAGWLFVQARDPLLAASDARDEVQGTPVRSVFVERGEITLIGTDLVVAQLPPDLNNKQMLAALKAAGLTLVRRLNFAANLVEARLPNRVPFVEVIERLQNDRAFLFVEPSFLQPLGGRMNPGDPEYGKQWQHANDGSTGGTVGADIRSERAWDRTRGSGVRIAIIDNGMQIDHADLLAGISGGGYFTDDGTGSATFVKADALFPSGNHGTFCLGMAGARMNTLGVCGAAPESLLMPVACLSDELGTQATLARAVAYAANPQLEDAGATAADGAHIIACSIGPGGGTWALTTVLDLAIQSAAQTGRNGLGVPVFWAVSNRAFDIVGDEVCSHPEVLAIGRSDHKDREDGTAFGSKLEFLAPGRRVYSTRQGNTYGVGTGTSYACPLAAGVAALILALHPNWTRDQVRAKLRASCDKVGGVTYDGNGHHIEYGHGRINAEKAVS